MGRLVITEFVSLDGVFEDPGGGEGSEIGGWTFAFDRGPDGDRFKFDELMAADAQLMGRVTYEGFAKAWPTMPDTSGFADRMNGMPKHVLSSTLVDPAWANTSVVRGDLGDEVAALKARYARDILVSGSGRLVRALVARGLADELRLMVFPIVLGRGRTLFDGTSPSARMRLVTAQPVGSDGVLVLTYVPAPAA